MKALLQILGIVAAVVLGLLIILVVIGYFLFNIEDGNDITTTDENGDIVLKEQFKRDIEDMKKN